MKKILATYNMLVDKNINIFIDEKEFTIDFKYNYLKHLLGLHKIYDNDEIKNVNARDLPSKINKDRITYEKISKSDHFSTIEKRLENFYYFPSFVLSNFYIKYQEYKKVQYHTKLDFDYMLVHKSVKNDKEYACLGLRIDKSENNKLIPVTYFVTDEISKIAKNKIYKMEIT